MDSETRIISGLYHCAYISEASCTACPYGDGVPESCYQLRRDAQQLLRSRQGDPPEPGMIYDTRREQWVREEWE